MTSNGKCWGPLLYTKGVLRQLYQLEPFHLCKLYLTATSPSGGVCRYVWQPRGLGRIDWLDAYPDSSPVV